jgi:hypothetical protein
MTITEKGGGGQIYVPRGLKITHCVLARKKALPSRQDSPRNAQVDLHAFQIISSLENMPDSRNKATSSFQESRPSAVTTRATPCTATAHPS